VTVHYIPVRGSERAACGRTIQFASRRSDDVALTTCQRCLSTDAYRNASYRTRQAEREGQNLANQAIKAVLDSVFESAYKVADRAGYCSTFEEIVGDIEVPSWYEIPQRGETFEIEVRYGMSEIVAEDDDAAYAMIAADVRKYISL
jgi:hypothetical protein